MLVIGQVDLWIEKEGVMDKAQDQFRQRTRIKKLTASSLRDSSESFYSSV